MASEYQLLASGIMETLDDLGLPDPYPASFIHATEKYVDGQAQPQADGYAQAIWRFDILSIDQWGTLFDGLSGESLETRIRTREDLGTGTYASQFGTYDCYMVRPDPESYDIEMGYWYRNVEVYFVALEEYVP